MDKPSEQLWVLEMSTIWKIDPKISTATLQSLDY
jgi:hypothetical protein